MRKAELRRATVLFADVVGFTPLSEKLGSEKAYEIVTRCVRLLDEVIRKHGGSVDKYLGDCLMAVFGYPVPMERAARGASDAALEMRHRVSDLNRDLELEVPLDIVIGINTGPMVTGDISGLVMREFHVLGDAVNVAARIKAKAPLGRIYVGPESFTETQDGFLHRELEPMQFKGKTLRVPVYELVDSRRGRRRLGTPETSHSALIGRQAESAALRGFVERLAAGRGEVLALVGEAGIGKSRLLSELCSSAGLSGTNALEAQAHRAARAKPLGLVGEFLARWAGSEELDDTALERALVRALPGDEALREAARSAFRHAREATGAAAASLSRAELDAALVVVRGLLAGLARETPTLVVLEDLQWADPVSLEVLRRLLPDVAEHRLSFLLSFQPEGGFGGTFWEGLQREHPDRCHELRLGELPRAARRELMDALSGEPLAEETRTLIEERAGGNPQRLLMATFLSSALRSEADAARQFDKRSEEAERRRATILFADISGFTAMTEKLGPEQAYPVVAGCLELLGEVARKHGGTVDKYLGDCVLALFGVPEAIEDAPRAALNAAIEMRRRVEEYNTRHALPLPLGVHSGINTGLGIAGDVSGPLIREFAVMGESVTVADHLKDLSPQGAIYVGAEAHRFTRDVFEFREVEPVRLKGRAEPVPAYELLSREEHLYRARIGAERQVFSALVGREAELRALEEALGRLGRGQGGIVSLLAEAGIGKSRLVAEFAAAPAARGVLWLEGRSLSTGQQLSFHPFADLLRGWAGIVDADDEATLWRKLAEKLRELLPDEVEEHLPFVATVMGLRLSEAERERLDRIQGSAREKRIQRSVFELLRAQARSGPVVLVMDDLHWADQSSIELLENLLRLAPEHPVLFLHVNRPGYPMTSGRVRAHVLEHHAEDASEIQLEPLDERASRSLLNNLFKQGDIPYETRQLIEKKAQGNPFYIEEVVRSLVDQGAVEVRDGSFRATARIRDVAIPGTVHEVVMARVDRLAPEKKHLLQIASVVGETFLREILVGVESEAAVDALLLALEEAEFVMPSDRQQGVEYAFKHPLIREVTYDSILHARREELHLSVAKAIEARLPENLSGFSAMLAYHFSLGRDAVRAEQYVFRAGDEAARSAASSEALQFFRQASKLYLDLHGEGGDPAKRARLQKSIARALFNRGELVEAVEAFNQAVECLGERVSRSSVARALRFGWNLGTVLLHLTVARRRRRPPATEKQKELIQLTYERGMCEVTADATRFLFDSIEGLARLSRVDLASVAHAGLMYSAGSLIFSFGGTSFAVAGRVLDVARPAVHEDDVPELFIHQASGFVRDFFAGNWDRGREIPQALVLETLNLGRTWDVLSYLLLETDKRIGQGDFAAARERIELNDKIWEQYQNDLARSQHYYLNLRLLVEQRRLPEALVAADAYYEENPEELLHIHALGIKAQIQILSDDLDGAEATLAHCAEVLARLGELTIAPYMRSQYHRSRLFLDVTRLERAVAEGDRREARRQARRASRSARRALRSAARVAARQPEVFRLTGLLHWHRGRRRRALRWWRRSLERARALDARPDLGRTQLEIGRRLRAAGLATGAGAALREARTIFESLGLDRDLALLEAIESGKSGRASNGHP